MTCVIISVTHAGRKSKSSSFPGHCVIIYLHMQESQTAHILMQAMTKLDGSFQNDAGMDSHAGFRSTSWYPAQPIPSIHKSQAIFKMRLRTRYLGFFSTTCWLGKHRRTTVPSFPLWPGRLKSHLKMKLKLQFSYGPLRGWVS